MTLQDVSRAVPCKVCATPTEHAFTARLLDKHDAEFRSCPSCGFLFAADPHWLEEAYRSPISALDTGLVARNLRTARQIAPLLFVMFGTRGRFVDYAGGTGLLTRLMRDLGFDFYWTDLYAKNVHAAGFGLDSLGRVAANAATAFEVLEHAENPIALLGTIVETCSTETIVFSTELLRERVPDRSWWYYAFETGQHISFYGRATLSAIAEKLGMRFYTVGTLHMLTRRRLNPVLFRILVGPMSRILTPIVRSLLNSRTLDDQRLLRGSVHASRLENADRASGHDRELSGEPDQQVRDSGS